MISRERLKEIVREEIMSMTEESTAATQEATPAPTLEKSPARGVWAGLASQMTEYNASAAGFHTNAAGFKADKWGDEKNADISPSTDGLPFEE